MTIRVACFPASSFPGGVDFEANAAVLLPDSPTNVSISDDDPSDQIPGIVGSLDLETGSFGFDLRKVQAAIAGVIDLRIDPLGTTPAASFDFDSAAQPTDELIRFASIDGMISCCSSTARHHRFN